MKRTGQGFTEKLGFQRNYADLPVHRFPSHDGLELAYREVGEGRPLILLHGFTANAMQLIHYGPVATIAENGYRVILPDLRGHGASSFPQGPESYPPDILADDGLALIDWLGLRDYELGGYSLGGRIALRMLVRGAKPAHAIVAGQGLDAISRTTNRSGLYRRVLNALANREPIEPGSPDAGFAQWIIQSGGDPQALCHVLDTLVPTPEVILRQVATHTLVVVGDEDLDHATADALAATLLNAQFTRVPGNHFTALTKPELATVILAFLNDNPHVTS